MNISFILSTWIIIGCTLLSSAQPGSVIPPHRTISLPGLHAYADRETVAAGETIRFHVSSTVPYKFSVFRLGRKIDDPASDVLVHAFPVNQPGIQSIQPGSYVNIPNAMNTEITGLTLECWVRPWRLDAWQGLITQHDYPQHSGIGLFINSKGAVEFYLGDGEEYQNERSMTGPVLKIRQWHHVVGSWNSASKTQSLWINGNLHGQKTLKGKVHAGETALRLAAYAETGRTDHFLDGDLAMPVIYDRTLTEEEIKSRFREKGTKPATGKNVLACWPLDEEHGEVIADVSPHNRDGQIINRATWMIGGPSFDAAAVSRYGPYDPANDKTRGHGLRFASDDLYDCRWQATHEYKVPSDAKSGIYIGRLDFDVEGTSHTYPVTFIVGRSRTHAKAPIALMCASNTWRAYSATPFARNVSGGRSWGTGGLENSHDQAPAYCFYRDHRAGQPTYQVGLRMPWPVAGPEVLYSPEHIGYSHLMRGERFTHVWLEENDFAYDVIGNLELHRDPGLLDGYKTLIVNGHDEYWSVPMYESVERYLRNGGNLLVLSGNTMFWRVSFDETYSVMECRKYQSDIGGRTYASIGELYHTHDYNRGSLMREAGYPAWKVIGLDCIGWWGTGNVENYGVYRTSEPQHFLFNSPENIGLGIDESFGHAPGGGLPRVGGHEADVRLKTLLEITGDPPAGAVLPSEPAGIVTLARIERKGQRTLDYFGRWKDQETAVICEAIYWERPEGGRVFNAGAIAGGWALSRDPKFSALVRNVLHHFGVKRRSN